MCLVGGGEGGAFLFFSKGLVVEDQLTGSVHN